METVKLVAVDLDGTLLNDDSKISKKNIELFNELKNKNIITCLATGRSLKTSMNVIPENLHVDYLIFSSGAGIFDFKTNKLIHSAELSSEDTIFLTDTLIAENVDFMAHQPIPDNHHFMFYETDFPTSDFCSRKALYANSAKHIDQNFKGPTSQFLVILEDQEKFNHLEQKLCNRFGLIRATSPIDHKSLWLEIFPKQINKGFAVNYLCEQLLINIDHTLAIGNDFNDIAMLELVNFPYIVENAPFELKKRFRNTKSNNCDGVYFAIKNHI
jgi:Cof subfamily protein (haloacid dehalogenase superfamily)